VRLLIVVLSICLGPAASAWADAIDPTEPAATVDSALNLIVSDPGLPIAAVAPRDPLHVCFGRCEAVDGPSEEPVPLVAFRSLMLDSVALQQDAGGQPLHAAAVEHSDAYQRRAKIHKYASFATIPLFATELLLGQSLYNTPSNAQSLRGVHAAVGAGIVGLFGVNTVTGAWNLFGEGWSEKPGRTLRLVHGLLMMAADFGILATTASGPNSNNRRGALTFETDKVTHRNLAIASISVGTASYLLMLLGNR
jgi:hypothetical protein